MPTVQSTVQSSQSTLSHCSILCCERFYRSAVSETFWQPRRLRDFRKPPHLLDKFSTTGPYSTNIKFLNIINLRGVYGSAPSNRIWSITTLRSPKQHIWLKTALCGGWCQCMALRNLKSCMPEMMMTTGLWPDSWIRIPYHFWLRLDVLVEVCSLRVLSSWLMHVRPPPWLPPCVTWLFSFIYQCYHKLSNYHQVTTTSNVLSLLTV